MPKLYKQASIFYEEKVRLLCLSTPVTMPVSRKVTTAFLQTKSCYIFYGRATLLARSHIFANLSSWTVTDYEFIYRLWGHIPDARGITFLPYSHGCI